MHGCFWPCVIYGFAEGSRDRNLDFDWLIQKYPQVDSFAGDVVKLCLGEAYYGVEVTLKEDGTLSLDSSEKAQVERLFGDFLKYHQARETLEKTPLLGFHSVLRGNYDETNHETPLQSGMVEPQVERISEDRWRIWPADETWLPSLVELAGVGAAETTVRAVVKEHPQHEGVILRGPLGELLAGAQRLQVELQGLIKLSQKCSETTAIKLPNYRVANMLRRAVMSRPSCLAAVSVTFTDAVEKLEFEPLAAHRIGQLAFRAESRTALEKEHVAALWGFPGEAATSSDLILPEGVLLAPGFEHVPLGFKAVARPDEDSTTASPIARLLLATVRLEPSSVFKSGHAKFMAVSSATYEPEVRLRATLPQKCKERLAAAGLRLGRQNVVLSTSTARPVRREFVQQVLPEASVEDPPQAIFLNFEPISFSTKKEVLTEACVCLLQELSHVVRRLEGPVNTGGPYLCPDLPCRGYS